MNISTKKFVDKAKAGIAAGVDTLQADGNRALDATRKGATAVVDEARKAVSATGEAITDGWITTKVSATFVGETLLEGSDISVASDDHVVTLNGTVGSDAAKVRAGTIAGDTERVTRVVNQLVVTERRSADTCITHTSDDYD